MIWLLLASYLCGSIPFGLMIVRAVAGVDLRTIGSGNIGATNVGRAAGMKWAAVVLLLDAFKGAGPTWAAPWLAERLGLTISPSTAQVLGGTFAILGHMFPVWLGFRGGKGVATALGVVAILSPTATVGAALAFAVVVGTTRIVSLGSLAGAAAFGGIQLWLLRDHLLAQETLGLTIFSIAAPILIFVRHRGNIARLLRGEEGAFHTASATKGERETGTKPTAGSPTAST